MADRARSTYFRFIPGFRIQVLGFKILGLRIEDVRVRDSGLGFRA